MRLLFLQDVPRCVPVDLAARSVRSEITAQKDTSHGATCQRHIVPCSWRTPSEAVHHARTAAPAIVVTSGADRSASRTDCHTLQGRIGGEREMTWTARTGTQIPKDG